MNEQLQNALQQFLLKLVDGIERAGEFTIEQVPDVIQQALFWFALESSMVFLIGLFLIIINVWIQYRVFNKGSGWCHLHSSTSDKVYYYYHEGVVAASLVVGAALTTLGFIIMMNSLQWLQILVAPKWFIVSQMSKLI